MKEFLLTRGRDTKKLLGIRFVKEWRMRTLTNAALAFFAILVSHNAGAAESPREARAALANYESCLISASEAERRDRDKTPEERLSNAREFCHSFEGAISEYLPERTRDQNLAELRRTVNSNLRTD